MIDLDISTQEDINLLELIDKAIKDHGSNNKIKFAIAENFECHKYTHIDFSENMTVFVGESSNGKSSFMRMLDWVLYNSIRGDKHITTGETECRGIVGTFNGFIVKREITPSYNRYYVTHETWVNDFILEGFGVNVPYEVQYILGAFKVKIDDKRQNDLKLNYLEQGQGWFLTSDQYPSTVKAKAVGLLYGVHYLDQAIKDTKYELNKVTKEISSTEKDIDDLKEKAKSYDYLDGLKENIDNVEKRYSEGVRLFALSDKLLDLKIKYTNACNEYDSTVELLNKVDEENLNIADYSSSKITIDLLKVKNLVRLSSEYKDTLRAMNVNAVIVKRGSLPLDIDIWIDSIGKETTRINKLLRLNKDYVESNNAITTANRFILHEKSIMLATEQLNDLDIKIKKVIKLLPINGEIKKINRLLNNCNVMIREGQHIDLADTMLLGLKDEMIKLKKLINTLDPYSEVLKELDGSKEVLTRTNNIEYASERLNEADKLLNSLSRLIPHISDINSLKRQINGLESHLEQESNLTQIDSNIELVNITLKRLNNMLQLRNLLNDSDSIIDASDKEIKEKNHALDGFISRYEEVIKEIGVCPLCRSEITDNVIDHLMVDLSN